MNYYTLFYLECRCLLGESHKWRRYYRKNPPERRTSWAVRALVGCTCLYFMNIEKNYSSIIIFKIVR